MQSKQKSRRKAEKQIPRAAAAKAAKFAKQALHIAGRSKHRGEAMLDERKITAPSIGSAVRSRMFGFAFGRAAPCDLYPEGGLRISGVLPPLAANNGLSQVCGNSTNSALNLNGAAAPQYAYLVSPTSARSSSTPPAGPIFSSNGPLAVFASYFRRFRFRRLEFDYAGSIPTGSTDNRALQFSYEPDAFAADGVTYDLSSAVCTNTVEFPGWTPSLRWTAIKNTQVSRSDELYYTTVAGDTITSSAPNFRMATQGAILAVGSAATGTAAVTFGRLLVRFELDLYGFENGGDGALPSNLKRSFGVSADEKAPLKREEPEYVSLTPRRDLRVVPDEKVSVASTPAPRVASRK